MGNDLNWGKLKASSTDYSPVLLDGEDLNAPDEADCQDATIPKEIGVGEGKAEPGKRVVVIPDLPTMTKILFDHYKSDMFRAVTEMAEYGLLRNAVGFDITACTFNRHNCFFDGPNYYKIDRERFYAEVPTKVYLETIHGEQASWRGFLRIMFDFSEGNRASKIMGITRDTLLATDMVQLDRYLNPVFKNKDVDEEGERIWQKYYEEAYFNPDLRSGEALAERMGLKVLYLPVFGRKSIQSSLFFKESTILIKKDRAQDGDEPTEMLISPGTIVVNTNALRKEYSDFQIYHECYHYENNYLFFASQNIVCSDMTELPTKTLVVGEMEEVKDPLIFVEKQADRGAFALMMPRSQTNAMIEDFGHQAIGCRHAGEKYEMIGMSIVKELSLPQFRVRSRMVQLGYIEAKGCLNWADNHKLDPFSFKAEAVEDPRVTFVIDSKTLNNLAFNNAEFRNIMNSGRYIHVDGHVVRNDPKFVRNTNSGLRLTNEAKANVDACCLRFIRIFVRNSNCKYVFGRLNYDEDYLKWTLFYLEDTMKEEGLDEFDAKRRFIQKFPTDFKSAVNQLMEKNDITQAQMAEEMNMDRITFTRSLSNPKVYRNEDYLMLLSLILKLPDWLSNLLFKRARFQLDEDDKRQQALAHLLRAQFADGIKAADEFLASRNLNPLSI